MEDANGNEFIQMSHLRMEGTPGDPALLPPEAVCGEARADECRVSP